MIKRKVGDQSFEILGGKNHTRLFIFHPCHLQKFISRDNDAVDDLDDLVDPTFVLREESHVTSDLETDSANEDEFDINLQHDLNSSQHSTDVDGQAMLATEDALDKMSSDPPNPSVTVAHLSLVATATN